MGHGSDHGHGAEWTDRPGNYQQVLPAGKWNASLVELLKLKLQTVKHFLQAQGCVKRKFLVFVYFWLSA